MYTVFLKQKYCFCAVFLLGHKISNHFSILRQSMMIYVSMLNWLKEPFCKQISRYPGENKIPAVDVSNLYIKNSVLAILAN